MEQEKSSLLEASEVRRYAAAAFRDYSWGEAARRAAEELNQAAEALLEKGDWGSARIIYATLVEEAIRRYEQLDDWDGDLGLFISRCSKRLARCLYVPPSDPGPLESSARSQLLRTLYDLWWFDLAMGGAALAPGAMEAIVRTATASERIQVEGWLRSETRMGRDLPRQWYRGAIVYFLSILRNGTHEDLFLEELEKAGLYEELAHWLVDQGRTEEAIAVAGPQLVNARQLTSFADLLLGLEAGRVSQAFAMVETGLRKAELAGEAPQVSEYLRWLGNRYHEHGMPDQALAVELRRFRADPDYKSYQRVREMARQPGTRWNLLQKELLETLQQRGAWDTLVRIYLQENEIEEARSCVARAKEPLPQRS